MAKVGNVQISIPFDPVTFDKNAFDEFLRANGTVLEHFKAIKCPIGKTDLDDPRSPHSAHSGCSNGYIYKCVGTVTAWFNNNSAMTALSDVGILDGSVVQVTFPTHYDNPSDKEVSIMMHDRFYLRDYPVSVPHTQQFESNIIGIDKLSFPVDCVEEIIDANGKEYGPGDYAIKEGQLVWTRT